MTEQTGFAVTALWIYPVKGEPGISLTSVQLDPEGLAGDRRKKAAVHLVAAVEALELEPRANVVLDATADQLSALVGARMVVGAAEIELTGKPSRCPGVYASVVRGGAINVGDRLHTQGR
jgi:MOSC N-terminal beta barrel domain